MITDNILSQDIHYGYIFRDKHGKFLSVILRYITSDENEKIGDGCWSFQDAPVYYSQSEAEMVGWVIKAQKLKCKKQKIQISHTIEIMDSKKPKVNKDGERLKKA